VVVGCAALYSYPGEQAGELACLAVMPEYREIGYGDRLRQHIEARARALKIKRLCVLTTRTVHWFAERGYAEVGLEELPRARRELYNVRRRSKVLLKNL
jgi:amino-acid N-acetyltransferase